MKQTHFENEEALRSEHISDEEARRLVALWAEKQSRQQEEAAQPTVQAVGEGLGIPTEEVRRLLRELRARDAAALAQKSEKRRASGLRRAATWLLRAGAVVLVLLAGLLLLKLVVQPVSTTVTSATEAPSAVGAQAGADVSYSRNADGSVVLDSAEGHYEYHADRSFEITTPDGSYTRNADGSVEIRGPSGSYTRRADGSEEQVGTVPTIKPPTPPRGVTLPAVP